VLRNRRRRRRRRRRKKKKKKKKGARLSEWVDRPPCLSLTQSAMGGKRAADAIDQKRRGLVVISARTRPPTQPIKLDKVQKSLRWCVMESRVHWMKP
jgi:hypothetical protein